MNTQSNRADIAGFEFTAKVRWFSFLAVFIFMVIFLLALPTTELAAAQGRVNWDNRCPSAQCEE